MDPHPAFGRLRQEDCEFETSLSWGDAFPPKLHPQEQGMLPTGSGATSIQKTDSIMCRTELSGLKCPQCTVKGILQRKHSTGK